LRHGFFRRSDGDERLEAAEVIGPRSFFESDDTVDVIIGFETVLPPAAGEVEGRVYRWDEVHQWRFNGEGWCRASADATTRGRRDSRRSDAVASSRSHRMTGSMM
jgi:hypothetical protein